MEKIKKGFTRVTTPLQVYNNFDKIDPKVLQNACDRGTLIHKYCEMYAKGEYFPEPEKEVSFYLESFRNWHDIMVEGDCITEHRIYNNTWRLTGCIDLITHIKGDKRAAIIDIKTTQTKSKTWPLQLAAYKFLLGGDEDPRRIVLQLQKNGKRAKVIEYTDYERDWELYKSALNLWRYFQ